MDPLTLKLARSDIEATLVRDLLIEQAALAKGGVIGTNGAAPVALRFDDWQDDFGANIYPLLTARQLPASMPILSRFTDTVYGTTTTWSDVRDWHRDGLELWSHGTDHKDPTPDGYAGLVREIITSKDEIEAQGFRCMGWAMPGTGNPEAYGTLDTVEKWRSPAGRLLLQTYALLETDMLGRYRMVPARTYVGLGHFTVSDGATLQQAKDVLDTAIRLRRGVEFMCHAGNLGKAGNMTVEDFEEFLDYIVTKRDAGDAMIVTPSGLPFCDPSTDWRLDLLGDNSFDGPTGISIHGQWQLPGTHTIETSGGRTGSNFLRAASGTNLTHQIAEHLTRQGLHGGAFEFTGYARASGGATGTARVLLQDRDDSDRFTIDHRETVDNSGWQMVRRVFNLPAATNRLLIGVGRVVSGGVDWDDVNVRPI